VVEVGWPQIL
jgi:hypothetical protein